MKNYIALFVALVIVLCSAPSGHCQAYSSLNSTIKNNLVVKGTLTVGGVPVTGGGGTIATTENAIMSKLLVADFGPVTGPLQASTTYTTAIGLPRAYKIIAISTTWLTSPAAGTTLQIQKNGGGYLTSPISIPAASITNGGTTNLALTGTSSNLLLGATDEINITCTTGVTAGGTGPTVTVEIVPTADY